MARHGAHIVIVFVSPLLGIINQRPLDHNILLASCDGHLGGWRVMDEIHTPIFRRRPRSRQLECKQRHLATPPVFPATDLHRIEPQTVISTSNSLYLSREYSYCNSSCEMGCGSSKEVSNDAAIPVMQRIYYLGSFRLT
jgi:hypothetical protein